MTRVKKAHHHSTAKTAPQKMRKYREKMRAAGLRPIQIWVPDTRSVHFAKEAKKQSLTVSKAVNSENKTLDFIEGIADW